MCSNTVKCSTSLLLPAVSFTDCAYGESRARPLVPEYHIYYLSCRSSLRLQPPPTSAPFKRPTFRTSSDSFAALLALESGIYIKGAVGFALDPGINASLERSARHAPPEESSYCIRPVRSDSIALRSLGVHVSGEHGMHTTPTDFCTGPRRGFVSACAWCGGSVTPEGAVSQALTHISHHIHRRLGFSDSNLRAVPSAS